tara:strand:+ start:1078 stop:1410 length:333 start_codon:yes stop_codon:yes gene_type:complete
MSSILYRGLYIEANVDYDGGQPYPTYDCGGVPPSWDVYVTEATLEDLDEFLATDVLSDYAKARKLSEEETDRMEESITKRGEPTPELMEFALTLWAEDIDEELIEDYGGD